MQRKQCAIRYVSCTHFEGLGVNSLRADVVVAGIDQRHGLWESRQLCDAVLSYHHLLQLGQTHKCSVLDGRYRVGREVDSLQFVWKETGGEGETPKRFSCDQCK